MTFSESEKQYILDRLDRIERQQIDAILLSEEAFVAWLKVAADWILEKIINVLGTVLQWVRSVFF